MSEERRLEGGLWTVEVLVVVDLAVLLSSLLLAVLVDGERGSPRSALAPGVAKTAGCARPRTLTHAAHCQRRTATLRAPPTPPSHLPQPPAVFITRCPLQPEPHLSSRDDGTLRARLDARLDHGGVQAS